MGNDRHYYDMHTPIKFRSLSPDAIAADPIRARAFETLVLTYAR